MKLNGRLKENPIFIPDKHKTIIKISCSQDTDSEMELHIKGRKATWAAATLSIDNEINIEFKESETTRYHKENQNRITEMHLRAAQLPNNKYGHARAWTKEWSSIDSALTYLRQRKEAKEAEKREWIGGRTK